MKGKKFLKAVTRLAEKRLNTAELFQKKIFLIHKIILIAAINRHGGQAELVELPKVGLKGNTHFIMGDKNNKELADLVEKWLKSKGLDK